MKQICFDFEKDVNKRILSSNEIIQIDLRVEYYLLSFDKTCPELLFSKLFYEKECVEIIQRLKLNVIFAKPFHFSTSGLGKLFFDFILTQEKFTDESLTVFIITNFNNTHTGITKLDWKNIRTKENPVEKKIGQFIIRELKSGCFDNLILMFKLYVKIWNYFELYNKPFNNTKAIILYNLLIGFFQPNSGFKYEAFYDFESKIKTFFGEIGLPIEYIPIFDAENYSHYSHGYINKRKELQKTIEQVFEFDYTDEDESFLNLFTAFKSNLNDPMSNKSAVLINKKVNKFIYPSMDEIEKIKLLMLNEKGCEIRNNFLCNLYLYEYLIL